MGEPLLGAGGLAPDARVVGRWLPGRAADVTTPRQQSVVPPDAPVPGVGAWIRDRAGTSEFFEEDVSLYVESRYREGLTRID